MTKSTITREQLLEIIETDHVQCGEASYLARMALAFYEWHDKTAWVQTDKRFDVLTPWGKHRADVLKEYIEHLENRIAMDSKPAVVIAGLTEDELDEIQERIKYENAEFMTLYRHAQPVVPDGLVKAVEFYEQVKRENPPVETGAWKDAVDWVLKEACRAAMLQAGNSPAQNQGWIPVSERLPDEGDHVLVSDGVGMEVSWIRECEWKKLRHIYSEDITHWMPLPAAPQED